MAVAFDAKVTSTTDSAGAVVTINNTTLTVGSGANRALLAFFALNSSTALVGDSVIWDSGGTNQSMTLVTGSDNTSGGNAIRIYARVNPTPGNKTLTASWTSPSAEAHLAAASFTGVNQTGGVTSFAHGNALNVGAATSSTITITSATGDMVVSACLQAIANFASTSGTTISLDGTATGIISEASLYDNGAATVICTTAWGGLSTSYWATGCDIVAAPTGAPVILPLAQTYFEIEW